eukprot:jgi/Tetstr1/423861/TSEL_014485.t1
MVSRDEEDSAGMQAPLLGDAAADGVGAAGEEAPPEGLAVEGKATGFGTGVNIANNIIGAGMLSLPYVLREASLAFGLAIIVAVCLAAMLSFYMLAGCCQLSGHADYRRIGTAAFGPSMGRAIQATVLCYTVMACVSFLVLLGDLVPSVVLKLTGGEGPMAALLGSRVPAVPVLGLALLLPMSCVRDLRHFQHSSAFALCCDFIAAGVIVGHFLTGGGTGGGPRVAESVNWASPGMSALTTMPIVVVAANAHYNAPRYYAELRDRSTARLGVIVGSALSLCVVVYLAVALAGYLEYGAVTQGDMFNTYPASDGAATAGRAALSVHLAMTFPLIFNALRLSVHTLFFRGSASDMSARRAATYAAVLVPPLVVVGAALPEIATVFAFNGSLFGALIVYIYPAAMYARLSRQAGVAGALWGTAIPAAVGAFGVFLMVTGATVTALKQAGQLEAATLAENAILLG